jgi:hypothetical protein
MSEIYAKTKMIVMPDTCGECSLSIGYRDTMPCEHFCAITGADVPMNWGGYMGAQFKGWLPRPDWCPLAFTKETAKL